MSNQTPTTSPVCKYKVTLEADHFSADPVEAALEFANTYLIPRLAHGGAISGPGGKDDAVLLTVTNQMGFVREVNLADIDKELDPEQLRELYGMAGHPRHTMHDWRGEVENEDTILGYWDWVQHQIE